MKPRTRQVLGAVLILSGIYLVLLFKTHYVLTEQHLQNVRRLRARPGNTTAPGVKEDEKAVAVKESIRHAWRGYVTCALDRDELLPISCDGDDRWGHTQWTLVDALDTLYIAGLRTELQDGVVQLQKSSFVQNAIVSTFEATIRLLAGSLSMYELTGRKVFFDKAVDIGDRLYAAFASPSGLPMANVHLVLGGAYLITGALLQRSTVCTLSGVGTLQMEFSKLSTITGDARYNASARAALSRVFAAQKEFVQRQSKKKDTEGSQGLGHAVTRPLALFPIAYDLNTGETRSDEEYFTTGSGSDSFYEYLLKVYLLEGATDDELLHVYTAATDEILHYLVKNVTVPVREMKRHPAQAHAPAAIVTSLLDGFMTYRMEHLSCFLPGMFALGAHIGKKKGIPELIQRSEEHMVAAEKILRTCLSFYDLSPTGLSADAYDVSNIEKGILKARPAFHHAYYALRPETIESLFVMWRVTKDPFYRKAARQIHASIEAAAKVDHGYATVEDVLVTDVTYKNRMESFHLAETLKYLYLIERDDIFSLEDFVFNTEAHPMRVNTGKMG